MNCLSPSQLRSYEHILDQIQSEHNKSEKLRQDIEKEKTKLILSSLANSKQQHKIAHINVKIFSDIFELFSLYKDEVNNDISNFLTCEDSKFYLVEVFITNSLSKKLKNLDCSLNFSVRNDSFYSCKTIEVKDISLPIFTILAVDRNVINCELSVTLMLLEENNHFCVHLGTVTCDISYHFEINRTPKVTNKNRTICEISKIHNPDFDYDEICKPLCLEYQFLSNLNSKDFIKLFIQNCYHKIDLECFSELSNNSKNQFVLKFSTGQEKHSVNWDRNSNVITLKSNSKGLIELKKYFCKASFFRPKNEENMMKDIKKLFDSASESDKREDLCSLYFELRKFWTK